MTTTTPDAAIVSLLADLDWGRKGLQDVDWTRPLEAGNACWHYNGDIFTEAEMRLAGKARAAEIKAFIRYQETVEEHAASQAADSARINALAAPYFERGAETLGEVRAVMPPAEAAEFDEIMDRCAPDGFLVLGGGE